MKKQPQPQRINFKVYLYKSLFSFLVLGLETLSCSGCSYYLFGLKILVRGPGLATKANTHAEETQGWKKK